jgi:hypothetical protein
LHRRPLQSASLGGGWGVRERCCTGSGTTRWSSRSRQLRPYKHQITSIFIKTLKSVWEGDSGIPIKLPKLKKSAKKCQVN